MKSKKNIQVKDISNEISTPDKINTNVAVQIQKYRKKAISSKELISGVLSGNTTALSRSITMVESTNEKHQIIAQKIINSCLPYANKSVRIGITGVPGVGKSTFIEAIGKQLTTLGKKVAVLAVDPSSSITHGSILGDKTRMEELVKDPNAYIRPSPSGTILGGVARKTRETILLCEAAGFDIILVETLGVGQNETAVHSMVDFFLLLIVTGTGDELQAIKRGIIEMADAIVINKADGTNIKKANITKASLNKILHLFAAKNSGWIPTTITCSSLNQNGIHEVWSTIEKCIAFTRENNFFYDKRKEQNQYWLSDTIRDQLQTSFYNSMAIQKQLEMYKKAVAKDTITPFAAAQKLVENYFKK